MSRSLTACPSPAMTAVLALMLTPLLPGTGPGSARAQTPPDEAEREASLKDIDDGFAEVELLTKVLETVRANYVDPGKATYARLMASALRGMLSDLDPHSQFMTPEVYGQVREAAESTYEGVGITLSPQAGSLTIVSVHEQGPAARAGVLPGDRIVKLGAALTEKLSFEECVILLRGNPGETLTMTINRPATGETREFSMIREVMRQETVRDAMLLDLSMTGDTRIGYVRLLQFNEPSAQELADALDKLEDNGMTALVFDLRNNPGGLLKSAVEVLGEFLPPNTAVVSIEGRPGAQNPPPLLTPARQRRVRSWPMTVLVNHGSASASELVSGALQDLGRAVIVGTTTFGKGSVQSIIPSGRGTAIRLTTARYFTPGHHPIHGHGITPNLISTLTAGDEKRIFEYFRDHGAAQPDPAALAKLGDRQLERAVTALRGILAYKPSGAAATAAPAPAPASDPSPALNSAPASPTAPDPNPNPAPAQK
ncbi:MAG: S41 family peptidase [Verrucomicrobiaceae bacterium]|nr:MAG: S41 family peptidase [Verrucomicrobiaceae bacterium]